MQAHAQQLGAEVASGQSRIQRYLDQRRNGVPASASAVSAASASAAAAAAATTASGGALQGLGSSPASGGALSLSVA